MSVPLLVASILLLASLVWALYDEFYGLRPWKGYQEYFTTVYAKYLEKAVATQSAKEEQGTQSPEFQRLSKAGRGQGRRAPERPSTMRWPSSKAAWRCSPTSSPPPRPGCTLLYQAETASFAGDQRARSASSRRSPKPGKSFRRQLPTPDGKGETVSFNYDRLETEYNTLKERKAFLLSDLVRVKARSRSQRPDAAGREHAGTFHRAASWPAQQDQSLRGDSPNPRAAHRSGGPLRITTWAHASRSSLRAGLQEVATDGGKRKLSAAHEKYLRAFVSHPERDLLRIHDPELFGCSPCHGGNGRAASSEYKGHGRHKFWLWPLYYRENFEAGCQQCHSHDMVLDHSTTLNHGKELFRQRVASAATATRASTTSASACKPPRWASVRSACSARSGSAKSVEHSEGRHRSEQRGGAALLRPRRNLRLRIQRLEAKAEQLRRDARSLLREDKKVGPNLKEIRAKLRPEWIPVWLDNPHAWRPTTKMPRFRLDEHDVQVISAFLWQNALKADVPRNPPGNAARGKGLFETRGCLACHSIGEGDSMTGGHFAANLSRVGEKDNYDYLVKWIHNPRERLRPYCPLEKRDLTPEDYTKKGLPFVFDLEHSTCPNDGAELQVQNATPMPVLRLTVEDARDIATYLMTQKKQEPSSYAKADYLNDPKLFEEGKTKVKFYGCAGCHEISGLEDEGRIGTELTAEGAKPIERLDFALLTEDAKRGVLPDGARSSRGSWYDHKGFFEQKLANPAVYDKGKEDTKPELEQLKMPKPNLTPEDITALTTFLLGSVDPGYGFPTSYLYRPEGGPAKDIQEGWWIVSKYNCMGYHQIRIGQRSALMDMPQYQTPEARSSSRPCSSAPGRAQSRLDDEVPREPGAEQDRHQRNGVRTYLQVRMPTFNFSEQEIQMLVRFFQALSAQEQPYLPPKLVPLTEQERTLARQLFTHPAAPCLKCHAYGVPAHDRTATAPNFVLARERLKPAWTERWIVDPAKIIPAPPCPQGSSAARATAGCSPPRTRRRPRAIPATTPTCSCVTSSS
jgi:hypothetical protein